MTYKEVIELLATNKNQRGIDNWDRTGFKGLKSWGIGLTQIRKLAKKVERNHNLALELWKSDYFDARQMACLIEEYKKVTEAQIDLQVKSINFWLLSHTYIGDLVAKIETARLTRTLGTLLSNGVPLLSALSIARNVISNTVLRKDVSDASREVKTGGGLARNLAKGGRFPRLALQMISVGEETGQLDTMLLKVSDSFDIEVRNAIERIMSIFTPVVTLLLAVMIGTIVMSVLLAIMSINDLVG